MSDDQRFSAPGNKRQFSGPPRFLKGLSGVGWDGVGWGGCEGVWVWGGGWVCAVSEEQPF